MEYEQRVIIKYLANSGLTADETEEKLRAQFAEEAYSLHTVQFCIAEVKEAAMTSAMSLAHGDLPRQNSRTEFNRCWITVCSTPPDRLRRFCRFHTLLC
jgi:hypothetical protein